MHESPDNYPKHEEHNQKSLCTNELIKVLLTNRNHPFMDEGELTQRNKDFFDYYSQQKLILCPKELAHKTDDANVIITIPLKHKHIELRRAMIIPDKYAKGSLFEDPETPIIEGTHIIEAINQLGSYIIEEKNILFSVSKFIGMKNRSLAKSIMKQEKHASIEIHGIEVTPLPGGTELGSFKVVVYKGKDVIGGGIFIFSIAPYKEHMVETDLKSGDSYKIARANRFLSRFM